MYRLTADFPRFHSVARRLIWETELPAIRSLLILAGASDVVFRNSVKERANFNLFVSDIDLSVIAFPEQFSFISQSASQLRKILPNLGEIEFYTPDEWSLLQRLLNDPNANFWNRLLLLRKLNWQKKALNAVGKNPYQRTKLERGILVTSQKLQIRSDHFYLDEIFPEMNSPDTESDYPSQYSLFLEQDLQFSNPATARNFWSILPDSRNIPSLMMRKELKRYILKREYFLTLVSIRSDIIEGKIADLEKKNAWLTELKARIDS